MSGTPIPGSAPSPPSMTGRSLIQWVGDHCGVVLEQPCADVAGSIAMRLPNAARNAKTLRRARIDLGLGVAFDSEAWRNQCRRDHVLRRPAFRELGYDVSDLFSMERLNINRPLTAAQCGTYAAAHLDAQVRADPTIFQTPAHISPGRVALENDIALAEATLELIDARGLREPRDGDPHGRPRAVFASICVPSATLTGARVAQLVDRYVRLDVDGFWIWAVGFTPTGIRAELMLRLVLALQENSGLPACPGGLGHLWQAALARGAAGAIAGPDRGAVIFDPDQEPPKPRDPEDEEEQDGRRIHVYHGAIKGCFAFDKKGQAAEALAFKRNPCECGHHDPDQPPRGRTKTIAHNQTWRLADARDVCVGDAAQASRVLQSRLPAANTERADVGLKEGLPVGWRRSLEPWDQAPVGWGAAKGRAA